MELKFVKESWSGVMEIDHNPTRNMNLSSAHLLMQILAWMWSVIFSLSLGSYLAFGISSIAHTLLLGGVFVTLAVFQASEKSNG